MKAIKRILISIVVLILLFFLSIRIMYDSIKNGTFDSPEESAVRERLLQAILEGSTEIKISDLTTFEWKEVCISADNWRINNQRLPYSENYWSLGFILPNDETYLLAMRVDKYMRAFWRRKEPFCSTSKEARLVLSTCGDSKSQEYKCFKLEPHN